MNAAIGIDQGYTATGIAVVNENNEVISVKEIKKKAKESRLSFRKRLRRELKNIYKKAENDNLQIKAVMTERVRTFTSEKNATKSFFMAVKTITAHTQIITTVADYAYIKETPTYEVDTRSWKSKIVGTSKPDKKGNRKQPTIDYIAKTYGLELTDNEADAICIALYYFANDPILKEL